MLFSRYLRQWSQKFTHYIKTKDRDTENRPTVVSTRQMFYNIVKAIHWLVDAWPDFSATRSAWEHQQWLTAHHFASKHLCTNTKKKIYVLGTLSLVGLGCGQVVDHESEPSHLEFKTRGLQMPLLGDLPHTLTALRGTQTQICSHLPFDMAVCAVHVAPLPWCSSQVFWLALLCSFLGVRLVWSSDWTEMFSDKCTDHACCAQSNQQRAICGSAGLASVPVIRSPVGIILEQGP